MTWSSNLSAVIASLQAAKVEVDRKASLAAGQGLVIGKNEIHVRCPRVTGNLDNGYETGSKVEKLEDAHYLMTWESVALSKNGYNYQPIVEYRKPHLSPGIHAAMPQIVENTKRLMGSK